MNWRILAVFPVAVAILNVRQMLAWEVTPTPIEFATYVVPLVATALFAFFTPELSAAIAPRILGPVDAPQPPSKPPGASGPFPVSIARTLTLADQHKRDGLQSEAFAAGQIACDLIEREYPPVKPGDAT